LLYQGNPEKFMSSSIMQSLIQTKYTNLDAGQEAATETLIEEVEDETKGKDKDDDSAQGTDEPAPQVLFTFLLLWLLY
jgi:hypothetical protein